jgi:hypothetical protein
MLLGHQDTPLRMARVLARRHKKVNTMPMSSMRAGSFFGSKNDPSQKPFADDAVIDYKDIK